MSFPKHAEYKSCDDETLSSIPQHWDSARFQRYVDVAEGQVDPEEPAYSQMTLIAPNHIESGTGRLLELETAAEQGAESGKYLCNAGDVVYSKIRPALRKVCIAPEDSLCSADMYPLRSHTRLTNPFLYWLLLSEEFSAIAVLESQRVAMPKINRETLNAVRLPVPPLDEQQAISSFLDVETSKIDGLVSEQRLLIELLKEKRQAVISHAVTKGLCPGAPMKPSGIQWLGDVPKHWSTTILKRLVAERRPITYGIVQPGEPDPNGRFMIRGGDYSVSWCEPDGVFRVSDAIEIPYTRSRMKAGDLIITIVGAGVGNVAVIPEWLDGANITQTSARIALDPEKANAEFVCLALQGIIGQRNLDLNVYGSAQPRLNIAHVDVYVMTVPPLEEQQEIVDFIEDKVDRFDALETEAKRAIELLQERRTALISAAVTGKIDVREIVHDKATA